MKRIALALAATIAFLLPVSANAGTVHGHVRSVSHSARAIDWD